MTSTVFQFLVAGALVMAWIWMLGRPLLTMLARRSRRDSVGHFRMQQAAIGRSIAAESPGRTGWPSGLHPMARWRDQPIERRRLQLLLASAIAAFASLLLAIALRGLFIRLFLLMAIGFVLHVLMGALIGARELRAMEAAPADGGRAGRSRRVVRAEPSHLAAADAEPLVDRDPRFAAGFFESVPEFEHRRVQPMAGPMAPAAPQVPTVEPAATVESDTVVEPLGLEPGKAVESDAAVESDGVVEPAAVEPDAAVEPTFTAPAVERNRPQRRPKARPIYIESDIDEGDDGTIRVVND